MVMLIEEVYELCPPHLNTVATIPCEMQMS